MKTKLETQREKRAKVRIERLQNKLTQQELAKEIIDIVGEYYGVNLYEDTNRSIVARPRTTAIYLIEKHAPRVSLTFLGGLLNRGYSNFSILLSRLKEQLPYDKQRRAEINELDLIIQVSAINKEQTLKDKLVIESLNILNEMKAPQLKHFLKQATNFIEEIKVTYDEVI
jgi:hypothetical protein